MNEEIQKAQAIQTRFEDIVKRQKELLQRKFDTEILLLSIKRSIGITEMHTEAQITSELDDNGKKKYPNAELRKNATYESLKENADYQRNKKVEDDKERELKEINLESEMLSKEKSALMYMSNLQCAILGVKNE